MVARQGETEIDVKFKRGQYRVVWKQIVNFHRLLTDSVENASLIVKGLSRFSSSLLSCAKGAL